MNRAFVLCCAIVAFGACVSEARLKINGVDVAYNRKLRNGEEEVVIHCGSALIENNQFVEYSIGNRSNTEDEVILEEFEFCDSYEESVDLSAHLSYPLDDAEEETIITHIEATVGQGPDLNQAIEVLEGRIGTTNISLVLNIPRTEDIMLRGRVWGRPAQLKLN